MRAIASPARSAATRSSPIVSASKSRRVSVPTWIEPITSPPSESGTASSELIAGPSEPASMPAAGDVGDRHRSALLRDALDDAVGLVARGALDDRLDAARGARHDRARLVGQHGRGAVDVERLEDAIEQLAQQLLEVLGAERGGRRSTA